MCQEHAIYQLYFQNSHLLNKKFKEFDSFGDFGKKKNFIYCLLFGPVLVPMLVIWDPI